MKPLPLILTTAAMVASIVEQQIWVIAVSWFAGGAVWGIEFAKWKIGEQS